ncbi:hypothetical protein [Paenibacillus timonensis]|uniref:hypothetical protein n=1 Tax=Paenibacillus timonensis TaxID=225915 RepID=UPI0022E356C6|nr:hypothetical protein [Paenibacillus timonensis]
MLKEVINKRYYFWCLILLLAGVVLRTIYLFTAQSTINAEEAALGIESLSLIKNLNLELDFSQNRFYSIARYVTALFFYLFGTSIFTLKIVSLIFSILFIVTIWKLSELVFNKFDNKNILCLLVLFYVTISPALLTTWSLKARGGFIESLFIGTLIIYLTCKYIREEITDLRLIILGYCWGIAFWIHPITASYIGASIIVIFITIKFNLKKIFLLAISSFVGLLPLLILNMYNNYNTFRYLLGAEADGSSLTTISKLKDVFTKALPMMLGLSHEITMKELFPKAISYLLLILFIILIMSIIFISMRKIRKGFEAIDIIILFFLIHFCLLITTSWGSFLVEPRRALPLYTAIPFFMFYLLGCVKRRKFLLLVFVPIIFLNINSNIDYVKTNPSGFNSLDYHSYGDVISLLAQKDINHVFTNFWIGNKVTFESQGSITWSKSLFTPSVHGFVSPDIINSNTAFMFDNNQTEQIDLFKNRLNENKINFDQKVIRNLTIICDFSTQISISDLYKQN